jgi:undecaprenyl-diphosphatase
VIGLDERLDRWIVHHRGEPFDSFFVALSRIGTWGIVWIILAGLAVWLWRKPVVLPLVFLSDLVAQTLSTLGKLITDRARPGLAYPDPTPLVFLPHTASFPSGHAASSFACAATLARFAPRRAVAVTLYVLAALIAFSRVYVGVHYPLDVIAGAVLGVLVATALRPLPRALQRLRRALPGAR